MISELCAKSKDKRLEIPDFIFFGFFICLTILGLFALTSGEDASSKLAGIGVMIVGVLGIRLYYQALSNISQDTRDETN